MPTIPAKTREISLPAFSLALLFFTASAFEPQDGSDFVENYTQTHSYTSFEPAEDSDFIENYQQTHSYTSFEPQEGSDFVENYTQTHSYSLEGDIDALAYELNLIETNEF